MTWKMNSWPGKWMFMETTVFANNTNSVSILPRFQVLMHWKFVSHAIVQPWNILQGQMWLHKSKAHIMVSYLHITQTMLCIYLALCSSYRELNILLTLILPWNIILGQMRQHQCKTLICFLMCSQYKLYVCFALFWTYR